MTCAHMESLNPRLEGSCCKCGRVIPNVEVEPDMRRRDIKLERQLSSLAAAAVGLSRPGPDGRSVGDTYGLDDFADARAWPGGVRADLDADREAAEELADCRSYLLWGIDQLHEQYMDGDQDAAGVYARRLRALSYVIKAWYVLHYDGP